MGGDGEGGQPGVRFSIEELEHPADLFLRVRAPDLAGLYQGALAALYSNLVFLETVRPTNVQALAAEAAEPAETLRALLAEALYLFETAHFVARSWTITEATPERAAAELAGERFDPSRHDALTEVKAVTYHRLTAVRNETGAWQATFILDV